MSVGKASYYMQYNLPGKNWARKKNVKGRLIIKKKRNWNIKIQSVVG